MKDKAPIPSWLEGWHLEYQTCLEVWQELKNKASSHQLSKTQVEEVENLIASNPQLSSNTRLRVDL